VTASASQSRPHPYNRGVPQHDVPLDHPVRRISRDVVFASPRFSVVRDVHQFPDGTEHPWHSVAPASDAVLVVPIDDEGYVYLLDAYRPQIERWVLEVVAGARDDGESVADAAARELHEETGIRGRLTSLGTHILSTALYPMREHLFLAQIDEVGEAAPEPFEQITVHGLRRLHLDEAVAKAMSGEIPGVGGALTVLKAHELVRRGGLR
jgi:8-oxo-dGTP pyrophosphatase MutT (NUDIX family)